MALGNRVGRVVQVIGPVVDVEFEGAATSRRSTTPCRSGRMSRVPRRSTSSAEVEQHLGESRVRTVAMKPTDGMQRGMEAVDTGRADLHAGRGRRRWAGC